MNFYSRFEEDFDVVIIGGGLIGCAAAYYLTGRGVRVALIEKADISGEGSGTGFGAVRTVCRDPVEMPLALRSMEMWRNLSAELGCNVGYFQGGCLYIREKEDELAPLAQAVEECRQAGVKDCRMIGPQEVKRLLPALASPMAGALYSKSSGVAEPVIPAKCYAGAAKMAGAVIYTNTLCADIEVNGGRVVGVITSRGKLRTPAVINAAGVHAHRVARLVGFHMPLKVVGSVWGETEPTGQALIKPYFRGNMMTARATIKGTVIFGGPREKPAVHDLGLDVLDDLRIWLPVFRTFKQGISLRANPGHLRRELVRIFGFSASARNKARFATFVPQVDVKSGKRNFATLKQLLPQLSSIKLSRMWSGLVGITPDMLPLIGEVDKPKGFIMAAGWSGHGYTLGPVIGKLLSELIVDGRVSLSLDAFRPGRFAEGKYGLPYSFYTGKTRHTY